MKISSLILCALLVGCGGGGGGSSDVDFTGLWSGALPQVLKTCTFGQDDAAAAGLLPLMITEHNSGAITVVDGGGNALSGSSSADTFIATAAGAGPVGVTEFRCIISESIRFFNASQNQAAAEISLTFTRCISDKNPSQSPFACELKYQGTAVRN